MSECVVTDAAHHSADTVTIWHGMSTPAVACGFHATYFPSDVYAAHRLTESAR